MDLLQSIMYGLSLTWKRCFGLAKVISFTRYLWLHSFQPYDKLYAIG